MRRAIAADFAGLPGGPVRVIVTLDCASARRPRPLDDRADRRGRARRRVRELARAADFTVLVAPETRGILASLTRDLEQAGARLLGSSAEAVELAGDKARLAARLRDSRDRHAADADDRPELGLARRRGISGRAQAGRRRRLGGYLLSWRTPGACRTMRGRCRSALLQPFVPGAPMSASFLVGARARELADRHGHPADGDPRRPVRVPRGHDARTWPDALPQVQPAVDAVEGLRGFVGVDFIWDAAARHATILEINPRPTTSCVGLCRLLPPGRLARAWLDACEPSATRSRSSWTGLAELVHAQNERISFNASGEFIDERCGSILA